MEKKFSNPFTEASTSKIIKLPTKNPSSMKVDPFTTTISKRWVNNYYYAISLKSNNKYELDSWTLGNQLYILFLFQVNDSLNFLTQSIQSYTNVAIIIEDSIESSKVNCVYMVSNQNKFYLTCLLLWISPNMKKYCISCIRVKKHLIAAFMKINGFWTLVPLLTLLHLSLTLLI